MAVLIKTTGARENLAPANGRAFTLQELQGYVGGFIEVLRLGDGLVMWLNEDGKRLELPHNPAAESLARERRALREDDWVVGDVVVATLKESGEGEEDEQ